MPRWISDRRLYLTATGQVVEEGDPSGVELLIGVNGSLPEEVARQYGLIASNINGADNDHPVSSDLAISSKGTAKRPRIGK